MDSMICAAEEAVLVSVVCASSGAIYIFVVHVTTEEHIGVCGLYLLPRRHVDVHGQC